MHRTCSGCRQMKPVTEFAPRRRSKKNTTGYRSRCRPCEREYGRERGKTQEHREYMRNWKLLKKFGITLADYRELFARQAGVCGICGRPPVSDGAKDSLAVDHDHTTGKIRGLLCNDCNIGLGKLGDDIASIQRVLEYLKKEQEP